jgi:hypothetical protein
MSVAVSGCVAAAGAGVPAAAAGLSVAALFDLVLLHAPNMTPANTSVSALRIVILASWESNLSGAKL